MSEEIIRIGSRSYGKTFDEYWNRLIKLEQENKQLQERIKKVEDYASKVGDRRNELYDKIDKAIEFIKEKSKLGALNYVDINKLLEILGDK